VPHVDSDGLRQPGKVQQPADGVESGSFVMLQAGMGTHHGVYIHYLNVARGLVSCVTCRAALRNVAAHPYHKRPVAAQNRVQATNRPLRVVDAQFHVVRELDMTQT
jgi:hypothetical protein